MKAWRLRHYVVAGCVLALLIVLISIPYMNVETGGILPNRINSSGSLQILAIVFIIAALAATFDIVMGYAGLFSFGHALFFALGSYAFAMTLSLTDASFTTAVAVAVLVTIVGSLLINMIALRASLIAYSMVTLAFAQLATIIVGRNYFSTGGEEGVPLPYQRMPKALVGIANTRNVYWLSLALLVVIVVTAKWLTLTRMGRTWQAIRENDLRVAVMGLNVYLYKLSAAASGSILAGVCGIVYAIALGTAEPSVIEVVYSLGLIVMVTLGGKGHIWGAVFGGALYTLMIQRLPAFAASSSISDLPGIIRVPLSDPQLILGVIFIAFIFVLPGGVADLISRLFRSTSRPPAPGDGGPGADVVNE